MIVVCHWRQLKENLILCIYAFQSLVPLNYVERSAGHLKNPVEAVRVDGKLCLRDIEGYIL